MEATHTLGGTRYALRRLGLFLLLGGGFFFVTRVFAGWIGCPGRYVTGVPCDVGAAAFAPPGTGAPHR